MARAYINKKLLQEAIISTLGNMSAIAKIFNVSRQSIGRAIKRYGLEKELEEAEEMRIDFVEEKLMEAINDKNITGIIFFLKTKGRKRGYIENYEIDIRDVKLPEWFNDTQKT